MGSTSPYLAPLVCWRAVYHSPGGVGGQGGVIMHPVAVHYAMLPTIYISDMKIQDTPYNTLYHDFPHFSSASKL